MKAPLTKVHAGIGGIYSVHLLQRGCWKEFRGAAVATVEEYL